jgi:hypothetical protein
LRCGAAARKHVVRIRTCEVLKSSSAVGTVTSFEYGFPGQCCRDLPYLCLVTSLRHLSALLPPTNYFVHNLDGSHKWTKNVDPKGFITHSSIHLTCIRR